MIARAPVDSAQTVPVHVVANGIRYGLFVLHGPFHFYRLIPQYPEYLVESPVLFFQVGAFIESDHESKPHRYGCEENAYATLRSSTVNITAAMAT